MTETSLQFSDQNGEEHVLLLPMKDKKRLFGFMQLLFAEDTFAYPLLGSKPVSWASYQKSLSFDSWSAFRDSRTKYNRIMRTGWKTWEKYCHLFRSDSLWAEYPKCYPNSASILLINKDLFNTVVNNNKQDFQEVLHREIIDGYQLLEEAKHHSLMNEVLEGHQALMGIVLGFGRDNSWQFLERSEKRDPLGWIWDEADYWSEKDIQTSQNCSLTEHLLTLYSCPSFAGDPMSEESSALKKDYLQTKQKVLDYYKDKDFLEATLSLLAGFRPTE